MCQKWFWSPTLGIVGNWAHRAAQPTEVIKLSHKFKTHLWAQRICSDYNGIKSYPTTSYAFLVQRKGEFPYLTSLFRGEIISYS
jgi:hypothetical protein